jgi:uncharacterized membrane protein YedE/YeeE
VSEATVATLLIGVVLGYLGQRSRMCFVGGIRDFALVRDSELLRGLVAFVVVAWLAFSVAGALDAPLAGPAAGGVPIPGLGEALPSPWTYVALTAVAAFGVGLFSVLADGCPLRQHVMAGQGAGSAVLYLGGFYVGVVVYGLVVQPWIAGLFGG